MTERRPEPVESTRNPDTAWLLAELGKRFARGTLIQALPVTFHNDIATTYRCLEKEVTVPGVGNAVLQVDYQIFDDPGPPAEKFNRMRFAYMPRTASEEGSIAEMDVFIDPPENKDRAYDFNLKHREVNPKYRHGNGVGTHLYGQAETWVRQIALQRKEAVTIAANVGQADVLRWFTKLGYVPYPEDQQLAHDITAYPYLFETDTVDQGINDYGKHIVREHVLYRKGMESREPIRIWLRKVIGPEAAGKIETRPGHEFSKRFIAALESRKPQATDATTLPLGIEWVKKYARSKAERRMPENATPAEAKYEYFSDNSGEISSFIRGIEGTVMKVATLMPQVRLFTATNSPAIRTDYDETRFVASMQEEFRVRTFAEMQLLCDDDETDADGNFVPDDSTLAYLNALSHSYGTMIFNLIFDSAIDASDPENPKFMDWEDMHTIIWDASKAWVKREVGGDKPVGSNPAGSLAAVVQAALSEAETV